MGRPSKFDREEAVRTAMNAFWSKGYYANSVKALSEILGITRSSFYNAFESRRSIFEEALALYNQEAPDKALSTHEDGSRVIPLLIEMFEHICRVRSKDPAGRGCLVVNCLAEVGRSSSEIDDILEAKVEAGISAFEALLKRAVKQGEIPRSTNIQQKALALQNLLLGINLLAKVVTDEKALLSVANETLAGLNLNVVQEPSATSK